MTESTRALKMTTGRSQYLADGGTQYVVDAVGVVWGLPADRIDDLAALKGFEVVELPPGTEPKPPLPLPRRGVPTPAPSVAPVPAAPLAPVNVSLQQALAPIAPGARLEIPGRGLFHATLKAKGYDVPPDILGEAILETWARCVASNRNFEKSQAVQGKAVADPVPAAPAAAREPVPDVPVVEALKDAAAGGPEPVPEPAAPAAPAPASKPTPAAPPAPAAKAEDGGTEAWIAECCAELAGTPWEQLKDEFKAVSTTGLKGQTKEDVIRVIATARAREVGLLLPQE